MLSSLAMTAAQGSPLGVGRTVTRVAVGVAPASAAENTEMELAVRLVATTNASSRVSTTADPWVGVSRAAGRRSLRASALSLLSSLGDRHEGLVAQAYRSASTMTETLAALTALSNIESDAFDIALRDFESRWKASPLVMDKWYGVQAMAVRDDLRERLQRLLERADYDLRNPNRVRSLAASFSMNNPVAFHTADGWGYRFIADLILRVDPLNPALSARLCTAFESWRSFNASRREKARAELVRLSEAGLSRNALDIIGRALAEPA